MQKHSISGLLDLMGMTPHHWQVAALNWWSFFVAGWTAILAPYLLDAVSRRDTDWIGVSPGAAPVDDYSRSSALAFAGVAALIGNPVMGFLADAHGRILTITGAFWVLGIAVVGMAFSANWAMIVVCMCMAPFGRDGTNPIAQSLVAEWAPTRYRGPLIVIGHLTWNAGRLALTLLYLCFPPYLNWRPFFLLASSVPVLSAFALTVYGWKYESPRWLALSGNTSQCVENLRIAAESGDCSMPAGWDDAASLELDGHHGHVTLDMMRANSLVPSQRKTSNSWEFMDARLVGMKKDLFLFSFCFFCGSYASWGMMVYTMDFLNSMGAKRATAAVLIASPIAKIVSNLVLATPLHGRSLIDVCGRVLYFQLGLFGNGVFLFCFCVVGNNTILVTSCVFMALFFEEWFWTAGSACVTEAFPTSMRNITTAFVFVFVSLAQIAAGASNLWLLKFWIHLPIVVMASLLVLASTVCFFLPPDRTDKPLIDTCKKQDALCYHSMSSC